MPVGCYCCHIQDHPCNIVIFTPGSAVPATVNIAVLTGRVGDAVVMTGLADCTGGVITGAGTVDVQCDHNRFGER